MRNAFKTMSTKLICSALFLLFLSISIFDSGFHSLFPSAKQFAILIVLATLLGGFVLLVLYKGLKFMLFFFVPLVLFAAGTEVSFRYWMRHFADRSLQAVYVPIFYPEEDLGGTSLFVPHHYTLYNCRPNLSLSDGLKHNRLGFRDERDFDGPKGDQLRIVFIGGSTTFTQGIRDNHRIFSYGLERLLNEHYQDLLDGREIQIINAGMGGATSAENLLRLIFFVSEVEPDLVVIQHGYNDVLPRIQGEIQSDLSNYRKSWSWPESSINETGIKHKKPIAITILLNTVARSMVLTYIAKSFDLNTYHTDLTLYSYVTRFDIEMKESSLKINNANYFERNSKYMIAVCQEMGAKVLLVTEPCFGISEGTWFRAEATREHNEILSRLAREKAIWFYDLDQEMIKDSLYLPDGRHVSQKGSDLKRDLIYSWFTRNGIIPTLLSNRAGRPDSAHASALKSGTRGEAGEGHW